jgi:hypothetical protein
MLTTYVLEVQRRTMNHRVRFSVFLAVVLLSATAGGATPLTNPLTAEEVACNERQLDNLLERITFGDPVIDYNQIPKTLIVSYSNSQGFYEGLALTNEDWRTLPFGVPPFPPPPEHYLAFNLNPSLRTLLLNPARPELGQVSLNREQSSSNFVEPNGYFDLSVKLDPSLRGSPSPDPLEINNFEEPATGEPYNDFLANSTKPGRGLDQDGLLTPCHNRFTDFDRHVFAVLQRMVRLQTRSYTIFILLDIKMAIFRGEQPNVYRINVYPIDAYNPAIPNPRVSGQIALELELSWTEGGRLVKGLLRGLPVCQGEERLGCTYSDAGTHVYMMSPVRGGTEVRLRVSDSLVYEPDISPDYNVPAVIIDMEEFLRDTTWNSGFQQAPPP